MNERYVNQKGQFDNERGMALMIIITLIAIALALGAGSLETVKASLRTTYNAEIRSEQYYQSETGISHALSWMRQNSQSLVTPFRRQEFYTHFTRTAPSVGDNDTSIFTVPTSIKLVGGNDSAILTSDGSLGTAEFATTRDLTTGINFPAPSEFNTSDLGEDVMVRITLVDAIADTPTQDFGPPPAAQPGTDFYPVYRIDAMSELERGSHVFGYVVADVVHLFDYGIYGQDYLELRQECDSFLSSAGPYSNGSKRASCPAASNSTSQIHKSEAVYGSLQTNGDIIEESPYGGDVCADFNGGCPNKGETCSGEDCGVPLLEVPPPWATTCTATQGDYPLAADDTLTVASDSPADKCWDTVTVPAGTTLTLTSVDFPYYIKTLDLQNNSNSVLNIDPSDPNGTVELWVETIVGNKINGNQSINANGKPTNFKLYYVGANPLVLNGNADMQVALVAPNAEVTVSGSFEYSGALLAKRLILTGSGGIHYDESLGGGGKATDTQYRLRTLAQYYR